MNFQQNPVDNPIKNPAKSGVWTFSKTCQQKQSGFRKPPKTFRNLTHQLINNHAQSSPMPNQNPRCPVCHSRNIVKIGLRKNKLQTIQRYRCKTCNKTFTLSKLKNKTWPARIILNSITCHNLGHTQNQVSKLISRRFKTKVSQRTIGSWINEYKNICTYHRLRKHAIKSFNLRELILSQNLDHNQFYTFKLHRAKLLFQAKELPERKFKLLKSYLEKIPTRQFPHHIFTISDEELNQRASQVRADLLEITGFEKHNSTSKLAELGLLLAKTNRERHQCIQDFMLTNDSATVAAEVPVYLTSDDIRYFKSRGFSINIHNYRTPITGHIDLLQLRNNLIHILDYKPQANKINAVSQLTIYALALASRTKLALKDFKCAWFDENNYYEFFPLHAVYESRQNRLI